MCILSTLKDVQYHYQNYKLNITSDTIAHTLELLKLILLPHDIKTNFKLTLKLN